MHPPGGFASVVGLPPLRHAEWVAEQIHSHPLDAVARLIKRQSLLAMSAVRESAGLASETPDRASAVRRLRNRLAGVGAYPASLLRRADRPNERPPRKGAACRWCHVLLQRRLVPFMFCGELPVMEGARQLRRPARHTA